MGEAPGPEHGTDKGKVVDMVVDAEALDNNGPGVNAEDDKDEGDTSHNPHDRYGPRALASHGHLEGWC